MNNLSFSQILAFANFTESYSYDDYILFLEPSSSEYKIYVFKNHDEYFFLDSFLNSGNKEMLMQTLRISPSDYRLVSDMTDVHLNIPNSISLNDLTTRLLDFNPIVDTTVFYNKFLCNFLYFDSFDNFKIPLFLNKKLVNSFTFSNSLKSNSSLLNSCPGYSALIESESKILNVFTDFKFADFYNQNSTCQDPFLFIPFYKNSLSFIPLEKYFKKFDSILLFQSDDFYETLYPFFFIISFETHLLKYNFSFSCIDNEYYFFIQTDSYDQTLNLSNSIKSCFLNEIRNLKKTHTLKEILPDFGFVYYSNKCYFKFSQNLYFDKLIVCFLIEHLKSKCIIANLIKPSLIQRFFIKSSLSSTPSLADEVDSLSSDPILYKNIDEDLSSDSTSENINTFPLESISFDSVPDEDIQLNTSVIEDSVINEDHSSESNFDDNFSFSPEDQDFNSLSEIEQIESVSSDSNDEDAIIDTNGFF